MTDNNTPAFPVFPETSGGHAAAFTGMTLRDYFAAKAMPTLLQLIDTFPDENWRMGVALDAYMMADAMLEARK